MNTEVSCAMDKSTWTSKHTLRFLSVRISHLEQASNLYRQHWTIAELFPSRTGHLHSWYMIGCTPLILAIRARTSTELSWTVWRWQTTADHSRLVRSRCRKSASACTKCASSCCSCPNCPAIAETSSVCNVHAVQSTASAATIHLMHTPRTTQIAYCAFTHTLSTDAVFTHHNTVEFWNAGEALR